MVSFEINKSGFHRVVYSPGGVSGRSRSCSGLGRYKHTKEDMLKISICRTKRMIRRIILNQDFSKISFLTLTFKDNIVDLEVARYEFIKFMYRLNYFLFKTKKRKLKYIAVPERQQRGAWHFHVLLFGVPYIPNDDVSKIWKNGFIKINQVEFQNIMEVANYLMKYITKASESQKRYFVSRNLERGVKISFSDFRDDEVKYFLQQMYSQDDFRFVSAYEYQYQENGLSLFVLFEMYFSRHFYDWVLRMFRNVTHFQRSIFWERDIQREKNFYWDMVSRDGLDS